MQGRGSSTAPGSPDLGRWLRTILEIFAVALVYVALAKSSLALASINPSASPIWPPTGFALATVLLLGYRVWPAIFVAAFIVNVTTAGSVATSLAIAMGNTLESAVGAYLINRWSHGAGTFETLFEAPLAVCLDNFSEDEHFPYVHSFFGWGEDGCPEVEHSVDPGAVMDIVGHHRQRPVRTARGVRGLGGGSSR